MGAAAGGRAVLLVVPVLLVGVPVAGCAGGAGVAGSSAVGSSAVPTTSVPTVSSSADDPEVLLAEAEEALEAYIAVADQIAADGGVNPERLKPFVTDERYEVDLRGFEALEKVDARQVGSLKFRNLNLQRWDDSNIVAYVCFDATDTDIVDSDGYSGVADEADGLSSVTVTFWRSETSLLIDEVSPWASNICL
ncbi:MAG: hypothetical protein QM635_11830 [Microbacteriaceae bacterium]